MGSTGVSIVGSRLAPEAVGWCSWSRNARADLPPAVPGPVPVLVGKAKVEADSGPRN